MPAAGPIAPQRGRPHPIRFFQVLLSAAPYPAPVMDYVMHMLRRSISCILAGVLAVFPALALLYGLLGYGVPGHAFGTLSVFFAWVPGHSFAAALMFFAWL